ncbi:hypothetical protein N9Y42_09940 [Mariniblastus sp.]|nr:hypothetical protein [Mariniblastus sp.]
MKSAIKYIELKTDGVRGIGQIVRVDFSKTGKTIYWSDRTLVPLEGFSFKANYFDDDTLEEFWVSNPRRNGNDSLLPAVIKIDDDAREEYWTEIRKDPSQLATTTFKSTGKTKAERERLEKSARRHDMDRRFRAP